MDLKERIIEEILVNCQRHEEALIGAGLRQPQDFERSHILEQLRSEEIHTLRDKLRSIELSLQTLHGIYPDFRSAEGLDRDL